MKALTKSLLTEYEDWITPTPIHHKIRSAPKAIHILGDIHLGAKTCDLPKLKEHISYARGHGAEVLLVGDLIESTTTSTKVAQAGALMDQFLPRDGKTPINWQKEAWLELFARVPILGIVGGNHEERLRRQGFDLIEDMCRELGCLNLGILASLTIGKTKILISHGEGAGRKHLEYRLRDFGFHDIVIGGHTHELSVNPMMQDSKTVWAIRSGSYLKYPRYAVLKQYSNPASPTGSVLVHIDSRGLPASVEILT